MGGSWEVLTSMAGFSATLRFREETEGGLWIEITQNKRDWYAQNPQFLLYCNQIPMQGFDIYHEECLITEHARGKETVCIDIDAWSGMVLKEVSWDNRKTSLGYYPFVFMKRLQYGTALLRYEIDAGYCGLLLERRATKELSCFTLCMRLSIFWI